MTGPHEERKDISDIIDAWEKLEGGRNYRPAEVAQWLSEHMTPAIQKAREYLGREAPGK